MEWDKKNPSSVKIRKYMKWLFKKDANKPFCWSKQTDTTKILAYKEVASADRYVKAHSHI